MRFLKRFSKINKYQKNIINRALDSDISIVLPEVDDSRINSAIKKMTTMGFKIASLDEFSDNSQFYKELLYKKKFVENWTEKMIDNYLSLPLIQGLLLTNNKENYALVAGATIETSDVIRSAIRIIGLNKMSRWISSIFFMVNPNEDIVYTYSDCGVIPEPDVEQLVDIAYNAANFHKTLSLEPPKVAFLSFSTKGSAEHYKVKRMQDAVSIFSKKYPNIIHEGEMQFDAAIDSDVARKKIKYPILKGNANVFIFPDLGSANIAYKITQYLAGYSAWGPLLCGLNKSVHDLSRGCSVEDIINITSVATLRA